MKPSTWKTDLYKKLCEGEEHTLGDLFEQYAEKHIGLHNAMRRGRNRDPELTRSAFRAKWHYFTAHFVCRLDFNVIPARKKNQEYVWPMKVRLIPAATCMCGGYVYKTVQQDYTCSKCGKVHQKKVKKPKRVSSIKDKKSVCG